MSRSVLSCTHTHGESTHPGGRSLRLDNCMREPSCMSRWRAPSALRPHPPPGRGRTVCFLPPQTPVPVLEPRIIYSFRNHLLSLAFLLTKRFGDSAGTRGRGGPARAVGSAATRPPGLRAEALALRPTQWVSGSCAFSSKEPGRPFSKTLCHL